MRTPERSAQIQTSLRFGIIVAAAGGFLDAYSFIGWGGVFAGAQTGNIVQLGLHVARWDGSEVLRLVAPVLGFVAGVVFFALLTQTRLQRIVRDPLKLALVSEIVLLVVVGVLPATASAIPVSAVLSFAAGIQLVAFHKLRAWAFSTTITQGNIVNAITATVNTLMTGDESERGRAVAFASVAGAFLAGAIVGGVSTVAVGVQGVLGVVVLLLVALGLLIVDRSET